MAVVVNGWRPMSIPMDEVAQSPGFVTQFAAAVAAAKPLPVVVVVAVVVVAAASVIAAADVA